jgi:hypothetical protein
MMIHPVSRMFELKHSKAKHKFSVPAPNQYIKKHKEHQKVSYPCIPYQAYIGSLSDIMTETKKRRNIIRNSPTTPHPSNIVLDLDEG